MAEILIADTAQGVERLREIVRGRHSVDAVHTLHELRCTLEARRFDLIVIGLHFDESRMFDALRLIKGHRQWRYTPVICWRRRETPLSNIFDQSLSISCRALGAEVYLDTESYEHYDDPDFEILCDIERHLPRYLHEEPACQERNEDLYQQCELPPEHVNIGKLPSDAEAT